MAGKRFSWTKSDDRTASSGEGGSILRSFRSGSKVESSAPLSAMTPQDALLLLQTFEESSRGWFWSSNADGKLTYVSESVLKILGKETSELLGASLLELFYPPQRGEEQQRTLPFILTKQTRFDALPLQARTNGEEVWWAVSGRAYHDSAGNFLGYRGSGSDITAQRQSAEDNSRLTTYDPLTGLLNRFRMGTILERTLSAFSNQKRSCAVMLMDLDRFKQVNDTLGHPAGDALLKQVAERLVKVVGDREKTCRLGGDEFQIILQDTEDRGALGDLAAQIIDSISQPYSIDGSRCIIGASIGIAISPFDGQNSEDLIRNADLALYAAKASGRGRFRFYSGDLLQAAEDRRVLEDDLRDALTRDEIHLVYQPVVNAKTDIVTGFEALVRWEHPERGPISPALFIPIAEEANLIAALGEWALKRACRDAANWPGKLKVAVNVSPVQFTDDRLPDIVKQALQEAELKPERLELEITESVFLEDSRKTDAMFEALKKVGVRLALDDFGTGYSSLAYLKTAPFDKIKIDQSFVRGATEEGSRNGAIIAAIVALASALNMETTAEGIESLDQLALMRDLHVSHIQGYCYSKPVRTDLINPNVASGEWKIEPSGPPKQRSDRLSMYRKVGVIHDNHTYSAVVRNLSTTGALIEGILDVPIGTRFVIDFGEGQLATSTVRRSNDHQQGIQFDDRLVSDGNGGLCTSKRISPYLIAAAAQAGENVPPGFYRAANGEIKPKNLPAFGTVNDWKAA
jgi:diguanylate cyclase (GGDEF)-like protein/PAS domain S-box-containing protein